jgi:hypothetical protein
MGFKERLRETAAQATEGLAKGQAKVEEFRSRQSLNGRLQALGQAYWVEHSGRATPAQLKVLLEAVAPAIIEGESRLGPLEFPGVPVDTDDTGSAQPAGAAPAAAPPVTTPPGPSDLMPDPTPPGPGETIPPGIPNPSAMPTSIHHEMPPSAD